MFECVDFQILEIKAFNSICWIAIRGKGELEVLLASAFNSICWIRELVGKKVIVNKELSFQFHLLDSSTHLCSKHIFY